MMPGVDDAHGTVEIIGGGIGGLVAAIALRRRGVEARVHEAKDGPAPEGAGIWVPTNAMAVLDDLELGDAVRERGVALDRVEIRDARAGALSTVDLRAVEAEWGHTTISIHRAALHDVLLDALGRDAVAFGRRCVGVTRDGDRATARFDDGGKVGGRVIVGADGAGSVVRASLFPDVVVRDARQPCRRGLARLRLPARLSRRCWEVWGGDVRFGFSAIDAETVYWFMPIASDVEARLDEAHLVRDLGALVAAFPDPVPAIVAATPADAILRTELRDVVPLRRWSRGRVTLLGDAAHPMTPNLGQGGAQAIEDAVVLADELVHHARVSDALSAYERRRMPKVRRCVTTAWRLGKLAHVTHPVARTLRNAALKATPEPLTRRMTAWVYATT